ncbi:hypothetical protein [Ahrensia marina]|uniref:Uncharacterized protein n=1 Tax=Ahrensia marina TaxID=1514904 RepID=A0A0N0E6F4_9HYPH|nr:hypothetical protein [Ahrensia marina]KPA99881.1 hypothetical protein SU32_16830 [Ahrensia marina]
MNRKLSIAAALEKNRIALLRIVFCWLNAALLVNACKDRLLPPRLARWIDVLISKAEKAAAYLLIASFYHAQFSKCSVLAFEKEAMKLAAFQSTITLSALTITGIIKRLEALQNLLHNLHLIARRLGKKIAARARVLAMKTGAMQVACDPSVALFANHYRVKEAIPP